MLVNFAWLCALLGSISRMMFDALRRYRENYRTVSRSDKGFYLGPYFEWLTKKLTHLSHEYAWYIILIICNISDRESVNLSKFIWHYECFNPKPVTCKLGNYHSRLTCVLECVSPPRHLIQWILLSHKHALLKFIYYFDQYKMCMTTCCTESLNVSLKVANLSWNCITMC